ncbi:hypothetical protein [Emcibacter sp.]|nr:hypothetical protein [Emcibacter sp.]
MTDKNKDPRQEQQERLAEALRENLKRRKIQSRKPAPAPRSPGKGPSEDS